MQHVLQQLESVRRMGRLMLLARRVLQFAAGLIVVALLCGVGDYLLRLPGWVRLVIGLGITGAGLFWLTTHIARAIGFAPDLSVLALRAERLLPHLAGALASGVEFSAHPQDYADPKRTGELAKQSVDDVESRLGRESLTRLLNPTPTLRSGVIALVMTLALAGIVAAAPDASWIAAQRWLMPLSDVQWPRRTQISSLTGETVQPADAPIRLNMQVTRGYAPGMRAWAMYRVQSPGGQWRPWQSALMAEQGLAAATAASGGGAGASADEPARQSGVYERLVDLTGEFAEILPPGATHEGLPADGVAVEFYFKAGDDFTQPQTLRVVPRPQVRSVVVQIDPPAYARGLIPAQRVALDRQVGRTAVASGLQGSRVRMTITLNKPVVTPDDAALVLSALLPGFADAQGQMVESSPPLAASRQTFEFDIILHQSIESPIRLTDSYGLENLSDRLYRLEARADQLPTVAMLEPATDESVLATATVRLEGTARDDVAIESIQLEAALPAKAHPPAAATAPAPPDAPAAPAAKSEQLLLARTGDTKVEQSRVTHQLDLSKLGLKPGDTVALTAVAQDIFDLDGKRHDPVRSAPRLLRIVDAAGLIQQIRNELGAVRQQAMRLDSRQQDIKSADAASAQPRQEQLTQTLTTQKQALAQLQQRIERNRLNDDALTDLVNRAKDLINKAENESNAATQKLDQSRREAKESDAAKQSQKQAGEHQDKVSAALKDLISQLDQGRDAIALQLQLRQLEQQQGQLSQQTRELLPRTAGRDPKDIDPKDRKELDRIAQQQANLARQADDLVRQMKAAAEAIQNQGKTPQDKATAAALNEAANIAQRQGLEENMRQAGEEVKDNKLSQAGQQQQQAGETLKQMLSQMQQQDAKKQEILRRLLAKLEDSIAKLVEQQKVQLDRLKEAKELPLLADALGALRRNTLAVAEEAKADSKIAAVTTHLEEAGKSQADGVVFLRESKQEPATTSETEALRNLEEALKLVREMNKQAAQDQTQQQRDELKALYEKLAKQQDDLRERTKVLVNEKELNRRQKAELFQLGNAEADVQIEAGKLREKVGQTLVFEHLHKQIDEAATRSATKLRAAEATAGVLDDQTDVSVALRLMAQALEQAKQDPNPFDGQQQQSGGQQPQQKPGEQPKPPLVPPLSELRLLRGLQDAVYKQTRAVGEGKTPVTDSTRAKVLEGLSGKQMELRELGNRLIKKMTGTSDPRVTDPMPQKD